MRVNKGIQTKEKRRFALDHMGGVDFSSSPLNCAPTRSPDAVNWIGDHGINRKRHGWEQVVDKLFGINSIYAFDDNNVLVHAGSSIYVIDKSRKISEATISKDVNIGNSISQFFKFGNKAFLLLGGAYDSVEIVEDSGKFTVKTITPYVPTTTINIDKIGSENSIASVKDMVNMLTPRRKNILVGYKEERTEWRLDGNISNTSPTIVTVGKNKYTTIKEEGGLYSAALFKEGDSIQQAAIFMLSYTENTIKIYKSLEENPGKITVEFSDEGVESKYTDIITNCTFGTLFGVGGAQDRLFLSGNSQYPNVVFFSHLNDPTYFPDQYTATFGTDAEPITGMLRLSDSVLAVMKRNAIYYVSGEYDTKYDDAGNIKRMLPIFRITAGSINEGCLNPCAVANFGTDDLFVSRNGVFAIQPTSDVLTNTRVARERSRPIASKFPLANDKKVTCFVHGQRLYVSDGSGACYVADTAYKYMPEGSEDYSYEWWYWDHVPATTWAEVNGELWFGTSGGRICRFTDGYVDSTYEYSKSGDFTTDGDVAAGINRLIYNKTDLQDKLIRGKRVRITDAGWFINTTADDGRVIQTPVSDIDLFVYKTWSEGNNAYVNFTRYPVTDENDPIQVARFYRKDYKDDYMFILRFYDDKPVVAEWTSPPLDFGTDAFSKTLFSLTVTAETGKNSLLEFGYETRKRAESFSAVGLGVFSFEDMDFSAFSFESGFQNSYTVRARDRNFNFLRFRLRSDGNKPCAVHRISALYKINKQNKGVV